MNISREKIDELNAVITIKIDAEDYSQKVDDVLKDYKKKAKIDGFRPGMVPKGLIKKLYYKPVLAEEINKIVSENLMTYIKNEKIRILGEPLPHHDTEKKIDFDNDKEFQFSFDIGLYPEVSVSISEKEKIPYYNIKIDEKIVQDTLIDVTKRHGEMVPSEQITDNGLLKGTLIQTDASGNPVEEGISVEEATLSLEVMKDKKVIGLFKGAKVGDKITFDIKKALPNDTELSSLLKVSKEEVSLLKDGIFTFEIKEILRFKEHELNKELFEKVYGKGQVTTEEEFREKIKEELAESYGKESDYRFAIDARKHFLGISQIDLPTEFLKRWMLESNENVNEEEVEKNFSEYEEEFRWQIIKDQIIRDNELKITEEEVLEYAKAVTRNQFYGYGMYNVPDDYIEQYAREQLAKPGSAKRMYDQQFEEKIMSFIKQNVKLVKKEITTEKFKELYEK